MPSTRRAASIPCSRANEAGLTVPKDAAAKRYCIQIDFDTIVVAFDQSTGMAESPFFNYFNESVPCLTKTSNQYSKSNAST
jgi:hypothetical protein